MGTNPIARGATSYTVARTIRHLRERKRISQRDLAALVTKAGRPMLPTAVSKIEAGDRRVDVDDLTAIAAALQVLPEELLTGQRLARLLL